VLDINQVQ